MKKGPRRCPVSGTCNPEGLTSRAQWVAWSSSTMAGSGLPKGISGYQWGQPDYPGRGAALFGVGHHKLGPACNAEHLLHPWSFQTACSWNSKGDFHFILNVEVCQPWSLGTDTKLWSQGTSWLLSKGQSKAVAVKLYVMKSRDQIHWHRSYIFSGTALLSAGRGHVLLTV